MIERDSGHIVTIASIAGLVGSPGLMDYSASKFGAVGFDESLRQELNKIHSRVRTTVICPSFIDTGMFKGAQVKYNFLTPILKEKYAAWRIVIGILQNEQMIIMPYMIQMLLTLKALIPISMGDYLTRIFGGLDSMDHFKGRQ